MSLFGNLYVGSSGLQTNQNALNTTAHNLSNVDTPGYTRQQVLMANRRYVTLSTNPRSVANQQIGLGVVYSGVRQVRDNFLDQMYRKESGRSMFYQVSTETLEEVEGLLGELNGKAFQGTMTDVWTAVQELTKDPSSSVTQGLLVQRMSEFVERAAAVYDGMTAYQDNLNQQIRQQVNKINQYGNQLLELNDRIRGIESGGVEHANDLRDTRNQLLDELAQLADISYKEDTNGNVSVQIEGVDFVKGGVCFEMDLQTDPSTGFYTPFWPQNASYVTMADGTKSYVIDGAEVFDIDKKISSDLDTDIGGLRAMLYARGDHRANYTDVTDEKYGDVANSVIMNVQAEFDQLIHNVVSKINDIFAEAAGVKKGDLQLEGGMTLTGVRYCESVPDGYMRSADGKPLQMFTKVTTEGYQKVKGADGKEYWVYNEEDPGAPETLYTLKNLRVNEELMQNPSKLGFMLGEDVVDMETAKKLKAAFTEENYTLNPDVKKKTTFLDYYTDLVAQVAGTGYVYKDIYQNQASTVESADSAREQVMGVASDEELSNMIRFQNAYNASSRYINVVSELLEHIISTLGR